MAQGQEANDDKLGGSFFFFFFRSSFQSLYVECTY